MALVHVLAHQGGWDEILMVAGPVLVFAGLLRIARKRAVALAETDGPAATEGAATAD
ncbi:MAG: hypothetical protein AAGC53_10105 [Actinomycetota bacterium]